MSQRSPEPCRHGGTAPYPRGTDPGARRQTLRDTDRNGAGTGRVPALVTESGTLTETPGLLLFVAQRFPKAELAPLSDPFALAQVQEFNSYLCSTVHVAHAHGRRGARWADDAAAIEAMKRKVPATMTECFELIERKLLKGPRVMDEQYTICDPYLLTIGTWIEGDGVDTTKLPRVMEHRKRMLARPAVQKAVAAERTQIAR